MKQAQNKNTNDIQTQTAQYNKKHMMLMMMMMIIIIMLLIYVTQRPIGQLDNTNSKETANKDDINREERKQNITSNCVKTQS
jgi:uncharacterized membrane protein